MFTCPIEYGQVQCDCIYWYYGYQTFLWISVYFSILILLLFKSYIATNDHVIYKQSLLSLFWAILHTVLRLISSLPTHTYSALVIAHEWLHAGSLMLEISSHNIVSKDLQKVALLLAIFLFWVLFTSHAWRLLTSHHAERMEFWFWS